MINVVVCEGKTKYLMNPKMIVQILLTKEVSTIPQPNIKSEVVIGDVVHGYTKVEQIVAGGELSAFIMKKMRILFADHFD